MLPSPPLSVARRAATAAASAATRHLLPSVSSLILEPSLPSPSISRRRIRIMPLGERAPPAPLPPCGRSFRAAAGDDGVKGEVLALVVVSFYRFADFPDHADFRRPLKKLCEELRVSGGIILAPEGINGSLCGIPEAVEKVLYFIQADNRLKGLRMIQSPVTPEDEAIHHGHTSHSPVGAGEDAPFRWDHVRVKLKKEIVSFGDPGVMPTKTVGKYVKPNDWNALISDPDTVYHLEGGILKYLEEIPAAESLWEGECFVFDKRVSVEHGLTQGTHKLCYGCKQPISDKDMESPKWEYGVSCPYCFTKKSEEEKERARARQKQFETWGVIGGPDKGRNPKRLESVYGVEENKK